MQLSLDCLTLTDTSPTEHVAAAGAAGFDLVSLWTLPESAYPRQVLTAQNLADCRRALDDNGVTVHTLEAFNLSCEDDIESYRPGLEMGAGLGAKLALAYHHGNPNRSHAAELLARFAETAREYALGTVLEPVNVGDTRTLAEGSALIRASGSDAGLLFDTYHLIRTGGRPEDIDAVEPGLIRYVQINDGPLQIPDEEVLAEVMGERLYPGLGEFPLAEMLSRIPTGIPWAIEAPSLSRAAAGRSAVEQAREALASLESLLERLGLPR
jgi:sugar phosphate isomerase/epimerase